MTRALAAVEVDLDERDDTSLPRPVADTSTGLLSRVAECSRRNVAAVLATVIARRGSTPATPGQKLLLAADDTCAGTVGGGALERAVLRAMQAALRDGTRGPSVLTLNLGASLGMCCGGSVDVLLEALVAAAPVGVVGAGHVATALVPLLVRLDFAVTVVDEREGWADPARMPDARVIAGSFSALAGTTARDGAVVVMTHQHLLDQDAIEWALRAGYAFVGGIGSRAKAIRTRARLAAKGFSRSDIARVRVPLGLAIGARTPEEIAVSIASELIAWRRGAAIPDAALLRAPE